MDRTSLALVLAGLMALLFVLERAGPLRRPRRPLLPRLFVNLVLSALTFAAAMLFVAPAIRAALGWSAETPFGLRYLLPAPPAVHFVLAFLLMDLTFYWWHVANHRIPLLWRFHNV